MVGGVLAALSIRSPMGESVMERLQWWGFNDADLAAFIPSLSGRRGRSWGSPWSSQVLGRQACVGAWLYDLLGRGTCPYLSPLVLYESCGTWRVFAVAFGALDVSIVGDPTLQSHLRCCDIDVGCIWWPFFIPFLDIGLGMWVPHCVRAYSSRVHTRVWYAAVLIRGQLIWTFPMRNPSV